MDPNRIREIDADFRRGVAASFAQYQQRVDEDLDRMQRQKELTDRLRVLGDRAQEMVVEMRELVEAGVTETDPKLHAERLAIEEEVAAITQELDQIEAVNQEKMAEVLGRIGGRA